MDRAGSGTPPQAAPSSGYGARLLSGLLSRLAVPARRSAVLDGLVAATMLTMGRLPPAAPDRPAFRTALRSSSSIARRARIIEGGQTIDEEWR
ncbi:hypothetical protein [Streptomyces sp. NPDC054783]